MQNLLTLDEADFDPQANRLPEDQYTLREAARAVLFDESGQVYLMNVTKHGYHKLPGGGIDIGESKEDALARELIEEVGCKAQIDNEVGYIIEYRTTADKQKQISYCYIARQVGEQEKSHLEDDELAEGMVQVKAENIQKAIQLLESDEPDNLEGKFIQKRDLKLLRQAANMLAEQ